MDSQHEELRFSVKPVRTRVYAQHKRNKERRSSMPLKVGVDLFYGCPKPEPIFGSLLRTSISLAQGLDGSLTIINEQSGDLDNENESFKNIFTVPAAKDSRSMLLKLLQLTTFRKSENFIRLAAVVIPIVRFANNNKTYALVSKRVNKRSGTYNDFWVFPGGHVEAGENIQEACSRECFEETNLKLSPDNMNILCAWQEILPTFGLQWLMVFCYQVMEIEAGTTELEFLSNYLDFDLGETCAFGLLEKKHWKLSYDSKGSREMESTLLSVHLAPDGKVKPLHMPLSTMFEADGYRRGLGIPHRYALYELERADEQSEMTTY